MRKWPQTNYVIAVTFRDNAEGRSEWTECLCGLDRDTKGKGGTPPDSGPPVSPRGWWVSTQDDGHNCFDTYPSRSLIRLPPLQCQRCFLLVWRSIKIHTSVDPNSRGWKHSPAVPVFSGTSNGTGG